jgi:alpha-glucosidase
VYQVYPRSFQDSNGDGLGDLPGVTRRIPYLRELGVDAIWLSPFYPSPMADGGYDVADYRAVDPRLGTLDDFDTLVGAAHHAGLRVVVDIVPNHTSDQHAWFQEALASPPGSKARDRYIFRDGLGPGGETPPSNWQSVFGGGAWTRTARPDGTPGQWYLHLFATEQPDLNWANPEVRKEFLSILRFWADRNVDGFRVDVAHGLAKDLTEPFRAAVPKEFDLPGDGSDPLFDRDDVHEIYRTWRRLLDSYTPPRAAIAEAWVPPSRAVLYARPDELGQAFNFDLLRAPFKAAAFRKIIQANLARAAGSGASSTWVLSNHDVIRHASRYALPAGTDENAWLLSDGTISPPDNDLGLRRARAATLLLLALPGSAYLYQGEELGLPEVADLRGEDLQDPVWRRSSHTRKGRDGCRVPLPWETTAPGLGFSTTAPHLPQPARFRELAVSVQEGASGSTLELYRTALRLRRELQNGEEFRWLPPGAPDTLVFARHDGWVCAMNFGTKPVPAPQGRVLVASRPLSGHALPGQTAVWITPPRVSSPPSR